MALKCADARLSLQASELVVDLAHIARATTVLECSGAGGGTGPAEALVTSKVEATLLQAGVLESLMAVSRKCLGALCDDTVSSNPFAKELEAVVDNVAKALSILIQRTEVKHRLIRCGGLKVSSVQCVRINRSSMDLARETALL